LNDSIVGSLVTALSEQLKASSDYYAASKDTMYVKNVLNQQTDQNVVQEGIDLYNQIVSQTAAEKAAL
jgi:hypothetical protein